MKLLELQASSSSPAIMMIVLSSDFVDLVSDIIMNGTATMLAEHVFRHVKDSMVEAGE